ncbi:peroxidasin-like [Plakobranchus ocellatus]|uniref:Peroxidasin-like n=1 Tax=Plakobranchus ocellatus TaxID=259542 RepID=A0AAV4BRK4_9GAST|nr:peroxidasin-like [Plakobranchus ocellatus]
MCFQVPVAQAVFTGVQLELINRIGDDSLHGFTPVETIEKGFGGIGKINTNVRNELGGIGEVTNIDDIRHIGDINYEIDHMNSVLETSLAAEQAMQLGDLRDIANLKDITKDFKSIGKLGKSSAKRRRFSHPENFFPGVTGMTEVPTFNLTINVEATCPLPFGPYFRSIDGTCAHPKNLGAATKPMARLLPPVYEDGIQLPRMFSVSGRPLPSPRVVSRMVHPDVDRASQFTIMLMQWGQIMDHDMVSTPLPIEDTRDTHVCCGPNKSLPLGSEDPECFPILYHGDHKFIGQCMEFVRSMPIEDTFGDIVFPRENMNAVTAFVDASVVYGNSDEMLKKLRDKKGQGIYFELINGRPKDNGLDDCIRRPGRHDICYLAGDERVNEHPGLTAIHTLFMRKHNLIAHRMRTLVPWMPDEMVFQKTRAIVVAITQKIMYNDWLPIILGRETVTRAGIYSPPNTRSYFDESFDPSIFQAFSTAVFRFGHTLIPKELFLGGKNHTRLRDLFFKPYLLFENFDEVCINLVTGYSDKDRSQQYDSFITEEVTDHLFETQEGPMQGFDLVALNLQRGRDHAIPPYNDYRELCGLHRITRFDDPVLGIAGPVLARVYDHPDDIELFSGGVSEQSALGGLVGETFNCLIARQMRSLKFGDRYFFTHDRGNQGFSDAQLQEIHKYTLSHFMCETTAMAEIQVDAFRKPGYDNPMVSCDFLRRNSLRVEPFAYVMG